ncbi:hypothetical protein HETIRDRAFT_120884 [Heterobasidion irregulare TC 32-1]|uniref:Uncharacterized protein n=1 Tax=Heterobasidion irregulare (strain TC 32-1) TaxID=747525 RepID=W4KHI6_HETIT|nr:uncharacterized protein HETIRDRAFT_120884 [Heterobasidion irregulare TC 32-1]ETW85292.1 hypothetical protein HETIRDRAFT_120884 [Heterobasidion irregulare TC 32-1]
MAWKEVGAWERCGKASATSASVERIAVAWNLERRGKFHGKKIGNERWRGKEWDRVGAQERPGLSWQSPVAWQLIRRWRESVSAKDGGAYRGLCRAPWHGALSGDHNHLPIVDSPATKSLVAVLLPLCLLFRMPSILPVLKAKLAEYMLSLPDGAAEYEDYELWGQGFARRVALLDRSARGEDIPELADLIAEAERGLDHMATDGWLVWGARVLPQRAARFAVKQQKEAEEQALAEETERVAAAEREAERAEAARAAAASQVAAEDRQRRRDAVVGAMFDGSLDPEEGERQLAELDAETAVPPPLFFPSPSPDPAPSADAVLVSTTAAMHRMSVDPTAPIAPIESQGKRAAAVVVEFARQRTPSQGRVIVPLGPGTGRMSTVWSPVERNGAGKMMQDPPGLMPGDVLADYACQRCAAEFTTVAFRCYTRSGQVSCTKCSREQKGCSFQPGWMPNKGKSKGKGKSKAKAAEKSGEPEPSRPTKKRKVEVLVPERSVGESIARTKAVRARKPVQRLPTTTRTVLAPSRPRSSAVPALSDSSRLSPVVAQGIASELRYRIAVAEGTRASLARSIAMWQGELASLEARSGGSAVSDVVLVEDSSDSEDSDMSVLGDFVPDV